MPGTSITATQLMDRLASGTASPVLDVRSDGEFAEGHVPSALHIPFSQVSSRAGDVALLKGRDVVVYCGHGPRAWIAAVALRRLGVRVIYLRGHWAAWRKAGLPVERS